jgi:RNA polymerase sigma-70 factor (ECF subfamily)
MSSDPESRVVLACQRALAAGSELGLDGPFRELYDLYKDRVYNVCFRISGGASDALDASQETFGILFRKLPEFRFQSKFSSWVYRIAVNAAIDQKRRTRSRRLPSLEALAERERADRGRPFDLCDEKTELPFAAASRHELEAEIQTCILRLSPKLRGITVLRYVENLSYEEISETLQISMGTVKSRLARAHAALDRELTPVLDRYYLGELKPRSRP